MTSKAAIKRRKRNVRIIRSGRPPDRGVMRTEGGQKSRSASSIQETEREARQTVVEARMRQAKLNTGELLTEDQAKSELQGYAAGRRYLAGGFGKGETAKRRLSTGNDIAAEWHTCRSILGYPPLTPQAANVLKIRGKTIENLDVGGRARLASNTIMRFEAALGQAGNGCKSAYVELFMRDEEGHQTEHMDSILQKALDALRLTKYV